MFTSVIVICDGGGGGGSLRLRRLLHGGQASYGSGPRDLVHTGTCGSDAVKRGIGSRRLLPQESHVVSHGYKPFLAVRQLRGDGEAVRTSEAAVW